MRNKMKLPKKTDGLLSEILTSKYKKPRHGLMSRQWDRAGWNYSGSLALFWMKSMMPSTRRAMMAFLPSSDSRKARLWP